MSDSTSTPRTADDVREDVERSYVHLDTLGKWSNHIVKRAAAETVQYVIAEVERRDAGRQVIEDQRANHRNLNRMLTLIGALLIGLALTFVFTHPAILAAVGISGPVVKTLEPYTFVITIFMDSSLAAYSFFKKY